MSAEAYERERQNNARLDELSAKVSALRGVTIDIFDEARAHDVIDSTVRPPSHPSQRTPSPPALLPKNRAPSISIFEDDDVLTGGIDGYILDNDNPTQRLRRPPRPHGRVREQGGRVQAVGDRDWDCAGAVLHLAVDFWGCVRSDWSELGGWLNTRG